MNTATLATPFSLVEDTLHLCHSLNTLLISENKALSEKNLSLVEENLKTKSKLVAKLGKALTDIKIRAAEIKADSQAFALLKQLQAALESYNSHARKNLIQLQARHQATVNFINMVRAAVLQSQPKAETYTKDGKLETTPATQRNLLNTKV